MKKINYKSPALKAGTNSYNIDVLVNAVETWNEWTIPIYFAACRIHPDPAPNDKKGRKRA